MLSRKQIQEFKSKGYLNAGPLLADREVESLRREFEAVLARYDQDRTDISFIAGTASFCRHREDFLQVTNIWQLSEAFRKLAFSPEVVSKAAQLAETGRLRIFADSVLCKVGPHLEMNGWHRDGPAFDILVEKDVIAAWIALDDVDETNGCMCMLPGSHLWSQPPESVNALLRSADVDPLSAHWRQREVSVEPRPVRKGEIHFHHGLTWHCSLRNVSGRPRRALAIHYIRGDAHYTSKGGHYFKPLVTVSDGEILQGPHWPVVWQAET